MTARPVRAFKHRLGDGANGSLRRLGCTFEPLSIQWGGCVEFRILGPVEVRDGGRVLDIPAGRARSLLALLVLRAGEPIPAERLIDELWGERPPATASTALQGFVSRLRKVLEPGRDPGEEATLLQTVGTGYRLAAAADQVDANVFARMVTEAAQLPPEQRATHLAHALALWRGPALAALGYEPFAQRAVTALDELRLNAREEHAAALLSAGGGAGAIADLEQMVGEHPYRERAYGLLMVALYQAGRQADALDVYRRARETLIEELGIEPGPELRDLEAAVLRHDPVLHPGPQVRPAVAEGWLPRERRTVTVVAADLSRPDTAGDPEAVVAEGMATREQAASVFGRYGGRMEQVVAGTVMGFFGFPVAHEDDPIRAVRAAIDLTTHMGARVGVETGDILVEGVGGSVLDAVGGPVVSTAYQLLLKAGLSETLIGPSAQRLTSGTVLVLPAGHDNAWRVLDVLDTSTASARPGGAVLFGRDRELAALRTAWRAAVKSGSPRRCLVVGEAGIGKTRLAAELATSLGDAAQVLSGRCPAYGEGTTFLPLRDLLDRIPGWTDQSVPTLFREVRGLIEAVARQRPVLLVLDDAQWAEPTLLDLVDDIVRRTAAPIMLLCLARPELITRRPAWNDSALVTLTALDDADVARLVLVRDAGVPPQQVDQIVAVARGNPLFAEQLLAAHDAVSSDMVPPSLRGLLAARLDALGPGERDLLRCASVIGTECTHDALNAILPEAAREFIVRHLATLERAQLVVRTADGLAFRHVLIQRAAYRSMTRHDRARLHEQFAAWLQEHPPPEVDELVGYHLEQAVTHRGATGTTAAPDLASRAGSRLADAAQRAVARYDLSAAHNLFARAQTLLSPEHPRWLAITQRLAEVSLPLGRFADAQAMLADLVTYAEHRGDSAAAQFARLERDRIQWLIGPDPVPLANIRATAERADAYFTAKHDAAGQQRATFLLGMVDMRAGRMISAQKQFRRSVSLADQVGDARERLASRWLLAEALAGGPTPVDACVTECHTLAASVGTDAPVLVELSVLQAMQGRFDEARESAARAAHIFTEEQNAPRLVRFVERSLAQIELLAGDPAAAEEHLRALLAMAQDSGERWHLAPAAARLATVLCVQGRPDHAAEFASLSARQAPAEGVEAQALSRVARSEVRSSTGDHDHAVELAREAVELVPDTMPNLLGEALRTLAQVLAVANLPGADTARADALACYVRKGNLAAVSTIRTDGGGRMGSS